MYRTVPLEVAILFLSKTLHRLRLGTSALLALLFLALTGCMDITGRGPAPLEHTLAPENQMTHPRVGEAYCLRGWLGIFSTGMDDLAGKMDKEVASVSVADEEWRRLKGFLVQQYKAGKLTEPLVLIGHSWGADDAIRIAEELQKEGITVDLLITIDPVTPPDIPANVKRVYNIYKSHPGTDAIPFWRGVAIDPATTKVPLTNIDLRTAKMDFDTEAIDHISIEKNPGVHNLVLEQVRLVCEPRVAGETGTPEVRVVSPAPATQPGGPDHTP